MIFSILPNCLFLFCYILDSFICYIENVVFKKDFTCIKICIVYNNVGSMCILYKLTFILLNKREKWFSTSISNNKLVVVGIYFI